MSSEYSDTKRHSNGRPEKFADMLRDVAWWLDRCDVMARMYLPEGYRPKGDQIQRDLRTIARSLDLRPDLDNEILRISDLTNA